MNAALWLLLFRGGDVAAASRSSVVLTPQKIEIKTTGMISIATRDRISIKTHDVIEER